MTTIQESFAELDRSAKALALLLLERALCMAVRDLPNKTSESEEQRLSKCDAFIEITHRITEQIGHYLLEDEKQRPDSDLFDFIDELCIKVGLSNLPKFAWEYVQSNFEY